MKTPYRGDRRSLRDPRFPARRRGKASRVSTPSIVEVTRVPSERQENVLPLNELGPVNLLPSLKAIVDKSPAYPGGQIREAQQQREGGGEGEEAALHAMPVPALYQTSLRR